jgi:hypothetical protein
MVLLKHYTRTSRYVLASLGATYYTYTPENVLWTAVKLFRNLFSAMAIGIFAGFILPATILLLCINLAYVLLLAVRRPYKSWVFFCYDSILSVARVIIGLLMVFAFWYRNYGELVPGLEIALIVSIAVALALHFAIVFFWLVYYLIKKYRKYPQAQAAVLTLSVQKRGGGGEEEEEKLQPFDARAKAVALRLVEQHIHEALCVALVPSGSLIDRKYHGGRAPDVMQACDVYHLNMNATTTTTTKSNNNSDSDKPTTLANRHIICDGNLLLESQQRNVSFQLLAFENQKAVVDYLENFNFI